MTGARASWIERRRAARVGAVRTLTHAWRLLREFGRFAWYQKRWWLLPLVASCFVVCAALLLSSSPASPFLYTLF